MAESAADALELLEELDEEGVTVDVIVCDQIMPGGNGDVLLARLATSHPHMVKIMLTGQASADAVGRAINDAGLFRYIAKPWEEQDLALTLRSAIDAHQRDAALAEEQATQLLLSRLALDLTTDLSASDRHQRLVDRVRQALGAQRVALFAVDPTDALRLRRLATSGGRRDDTPRRLRPAPDSALARALTSPPTAAAPPPSPGDELGWTDLRGTALVARLDAGDTPVGLLACGFHTAAAREAVPPQRLRALLSLAAASLRTARLIDALEAHSAHQRDLAQALAHAADARAQGPLLGDSVAVRQVRDQLASLAAETGPVWIIGPPGSGREAAARQLQRAGDPTTPFLMATASAGHGGAEHIEDLIELATGGTLYLPGVERLDEVTQAWLAARIDRGGEPARLVFSSTVDQGWRAVPRLHPDLDRRLPDRVFLPPLRQRLDDIETLTQHYLSVHAADLARPVRDLAPGTLDALLAHPWPGNVRELDRVVEAAVLRATGTTAHIDPGTLEAAPHLGAYRLDERIGGGAMGDVWCATHVHLQRSAAIKRIHGLQDLDPARRSEAIARFEREARATARLRSPHTVDIYDFGLTPDGDLFTVMELVEGMYLGALVRQFGPLPSDRVAAILMQACHSLMEAHDAGLVHRDLKPENLMVGPKGPDADVLTVLDFGTVQATRQGTHLTRRDALIGTPTTMAPELLDGDAGPRSDLYSLGCTAWFLLTGRHVFTQPMPALLFAHATQRPPPPREHAPTPPDPALEALIMACLEKDPAHRPADARDLRAALHRHHIADPWTQQRAARWWAEHA